MEEYRLLFCIASSIDNIVAGLNSYVKDKDYKFQIEHITDYSDLISYENFELLDCIIIQEFFSPEIPITIEYLSKLISYKNLNIICIFDESKRNIYASNLYKKCLFNCFFGEDAAKLSVETLVEIIIDGREAKVAKDYYRIKDEFEDSRSKKSALDELIKISRLYKDDEELLIDEFNIIAEKLSSIDIRNLILELPTQLIETLLCIPRFYAEYQKLKEIISNTDKSKPMNSIDKIDKFDLRLIPINSKNIGVVSLSKGAGASFFCMNFAKALSEFMKVSVIEMPLLKPYMYYYLGLNALCAEEIVDFTSYAHLINECKALKSNYYVHSKDNNIYWIISDASKYQIDDWDFTKMMRLLYMPKPSSMNIVDLGDKLFDPSISNIIEQFYMILVIIDPMIPDLLNSYEFLEKIKALGEENAIHIEYIINKYNKGINNNDLLDFLGVKPLVYLPHINSKHIYNAVYNAEIPYNNSDVKNELLPEFNKLLKFIVPKEIFEHKPFKIKFSKIKN